MKSYLALYHQRGINSSLLILIPLLECLLPFYWVTDCNSCIRSLNTKNKYHSFHFAFFGNFSALLVFLGIILYYWWVLLTFSYLSLSCLKTKSMSYTTVQYAQWLAYSRHLHIHWINRIENFLYCSCLVLIWSLLFKKSLLLLSLHMTYDSLE